LYKPEKPTFFNAQLALYTHGAACLDCGYVMLFLDPASLTEARQAPVLDPMVK
jgi:hypothetical protein